MAYSVGLLVLLLGAVGLAVVALAVTAFVLRRHRWTLRRDAGARSIASLKRDWRIDRLDPIAGLRSPYKPEPMCRRCLAVAHTGGPPFYMCRLNEHCGLLEDEPAGQG